VLERDGRVRELEGVFQELEVHRHELLRAQQEVIRLQQDAALFTRLMAGASCASITKSAISSFL